MCEVCETEKAIGEILRSIFGPRVTVVDANDPVLYQLRTMTDNYGDFAKFSRDEWVVIWNTLFLTGDNADKATNAGCPLMEYVREQLRRNDFANHENLTLAMCETIVHMRDAHNITF